MWTSLKRTIGRNGSRKRKTGSKKGDTVPVVVQRHIGNEQSLFVQESDSPLDIAQSLNSALVLHSPPNDSQALVVLEHPPESSAIELRRKQELSISGSQRQHQELAPFPHAGPQLLSGASIQTSGDATFNSAGRDVVITNITNHYTAKAPVDEGNVDAIIKWLNAPNYTLIMKSAADQRMPNTGTWFVESNEFRMFLDSQPFILWGTGPPGSGKTVLSAAASQKLLDTFRGYPDVAVMYAFLRYSDKHSVRDVISSLLTQLLRSYDSARAHLRPYFETCVKAEEVLSEKELANAFSDTITLFSKVFIVMDGLDEADDEVKEGLLTLLPPLNVNMLIMSRPLDLFTSHTPNATHIPIQARTEDIDLYVRQRARSSARLKAILGNDEKLLTKLCTIVKERSQGMFLVAHLQMTTAIKSASNISGLFKALNELPSGIDEMYRHAIQRIEKASPEDAILAKRVLTWILHAKRRVAAADLQCALAVSDDDLAYDPDAHIPLSVIVAVCGGLVEVRKNQQIRPEWERRPLCDEIRFIHYTTKEYLAKTDCLGIPNPHSFISVNCLVYLSGFLDFIRDSVASGQPAVEVVESKPLLSYAYHYWGSHTSESRAKGPLHPYIRSFLTVITQPTYPGLLHVNEVSPRWAFGSECPLTGLHLAAMYGLTEILSAKPTLASLPDPTFGFTPLHLAVMYGHLETLQALISMYPEDVNEQTLAQESTILHIAIGEHKQLGMGIVRELLSPSSSSATVLCGRLDVNARMWGTSPLFCACVCEGCHPQEDSERGETPEEEIVRLLLEREDTEVNAQDEAMGGWTALVQVIYSSGSLGIIRSLLAHPKIDPNIQDLDGGTALTRACELRKTEIVETLMESGIVDAHLKDGKGLGALEWACHPGLRSMSTRSYRDDDVEVGMRMVEALMQHSAWTVDDLCNAATLAMKVGDKWEYLESKRYVRKLLKPLLSGMVEGRWPLIRGSEDLFEERAVVLMLVNASRMKCPAWIAAVLDGLGVLRLSFNDRCPCRIF